MPRPEYVGELLIRDTSEVQRQIISTRAAPEPIAMAARSGKSVLAIQHHRRTHCEAVLIQLNPEEAGRHHVRL